MCTQRPFSLPLSNCSRHFCVCIRALALLPRDPAHCQVRSLSCNSGWRRDYFFPAMLLMMAAPLNRSWLGEGGRRKATQRLGNVSLVDNMIQRLVCSTQMQTSSCAPDLQTPLTWAHITTRNFVPFHFPSLPLSGNHLHVGFAQQRSAPTHARTHGRTHTDNPTINQNNHATTNHP